MDDNGNPYNTKRLVSRAVALIKLAACSATPYPIEANYEDISVNQN